jgi:hypothetical protein
MENIKDNVKNVDSFLEKETKKNKTDTWNKIDKTSKIKQLNEYVDKIISTEYENVNEEERSELKKYLESSLDKKKLQCVKDVSYDKLTGKIKGIPNLHFNPATRKFTIKRNEKRVSTLKSLGTGQQKNKKKVQTLEAPQESPHEVPQEAPLEGIQ